MKERLNLPAIFILSLVFSLVPTNAFSQTRQQQIEQLEQQLEQSKRCGSYLNRSNRMLNSARSSQDTGDFCRDMCLNVKYRDNISILQRKAARCFEINGQYDMSELIYQQIDEEEMEDAALDYRIYQRCGCKMVSD